MEVHAAIDMDESRTSPAEATKLIAFHLPQYYPTPYNDEWWGKGFTEWTNVVKARPRFRGHYQPHLPADLGFYDLRLSEARHAQAALAKEYGIYGFCYYHYWFHGRRVLELPVDEILKSGEPDFPFCLCWANENWTRRWDGGEKEILIQQAYSDEDITNHLQWLAGAFSDARYIRVEGKPLFLIYRAEDLPDPKASVDKWREQAHRLGIGELYLCHVENLFDEAPEHIAELGFDASVEFQPRVNLLRQPPVQRAVQRFFPNAPSNRRHAYSEIVAKAMAAPPAPYLRYPGICPSWDNSSRRKKRCFTLTGSSPQLYEQWLKHVIATAPRNDRGETIIFINAWNEWAEGCHLEPCQKWGRGYLEATLQALQSATENKTDARKGTG